MLINKIVLERQAQPTFIEHEALQQLVHEIVETCCLPRPDIDALKPLAESGTTLFSGQSGVGKTSLLNALVPDLDLRTSELSRVTGKGRHTTTTARAHPSPRNAARINTP